MTRLALGLVVGCLALTGPALAEDAYTVRTSDTLVRLALQTAGGSRPIVSVVEGEMGTVEVGGRKVGFTPQVGGKPEAVRLQFFELTRINGHEAIRAVGHAYYTPGQPSAPAIAAVRPVIESVEVLSIRQANAAPTSRE